MATITILHKRSMITFISVIVGSVLLAMLAYQVTVLTWSHTALTSQQHPASTANAVPTTTSASTIPTVVPTANASPSSVLPGVLAPDANPASVLGIDAGPPSLYPGIPWERLNYATCGNGLAGNALRQTIQFDHLQGV